MGLIMIFGAILILAYTICAIILLAVGLFLELRWMRITGGIALTPSVAVILWPALVIRQAPRSGHSTNRPSALVNFVLHHHTRGCRPNRTA
jgi:hypothetical protein